MSGMFLGEELVCTLGTLLDVFEVDDKRTTVYFLKAIDDRNSNSINKRVSASRQKASSEPDEK